ncbi:MAG: mitochondrial fission ELM1 family protein [Candidatus Omnitrophica bacterium]|nr:mitochondrial fission ELM1 family protein [Candidatus Omnitrophota bacterium]
MIDLIASLLVRGLNKILHVMPMSFNLWLGRRVGSLLYMFSGKRADVAYANIKAAYCLGHDPSMKKKTPLEMRRLVKRTYENMGETFVEILSMTKANKAYIEKYVTVRNMERIEQASKNPNGMILVSAHFGNWELSTATSAAKGFQLHVLTRDQKMKRLYELLNVIREMMGNVVIRKGADIKTLFRALRAGKGIGLLADQNGGAHGILSEFFSREASSVIGPYRLAQNSGACILPAFIHRTGGSPRQELVLEEPMFIGRGEDITPYVDKFNRLLEKNIRRSPHRWLWMHKRWKMTPEKYVVVLDDGKKGHLKQSLQVVRQIKSYRKGEGYADEHLKVEILPVKFKNKTAKTIFNLSNLFFTRSRRAGLKSLKRALEEESYKRLSGAYADVIVSCGSTSATVNVVLKKENYCRNLTILDPGFFLRKKFDLVVVPKHDHDRKRFDDEKTVVTLLAPNLIMPCVSRGANEGPRFACIGLLFGGDNYYFSFDKDLTKCVAEELGKINAAEGAEIRVTTSRRTSAEAEKTLKETLERTCGKLKFISGKEDKDEHTVEKILSASDVVIVSGESISMVSEAVSSGKAVLVFMPKKRLPEVTKYEKFVRGLEGKGYLERVCPEDISSKVTDIMPEVLSGRKKIRIPDDNKRIQEKMYKLF